MTKKEKIYDYEIEYIKKHGKRKCEANAILPVRNKALLHLIETIYEYLGNECFDEYNKELEKNRKEVKNILKSVKFRKRISRILRDIFELEDE